MGNHTVFQYFTDSILADLNTSRQRGWQRLKRVDHYQMRFDNTNWWAPMKIKYITLFLPHFWAIYSYSIW
jgi:hypothetical protein